MSRLHSVNPLSGGVDSMKRATLPHKVCRVQGHRMERIPQTVVNSSEELLRCLGQARD